MPKHVERRPTKLDYFLVKQRWQGCVTSSTTKWGTAYHRFGSKFDHGLLQIRWKWKLRLPRQQPKPDYKAMTTRDWDTFDVVLQAKLMNIKNTVHVNDKEMEAHYNEVTRCIQETIKEVIPKRKPRKYNGRTISDKTKALYDQRIRDFNSGRKITKKDRKAWHRLLAQTGETTMRTGSKVG